MAAPIAPAWPSALDGVLIQPPPPPDSPSGSERGDDDQDLSDAEVEVELEATPEQLAQQEETKQKLRTEFLNLARTTQPTVEEADATINLSQFQKLLKNHLKTHHGTDATAEVDDFAMDAELTTMWSELPKQISATGEGVTFPSLLAALSGEGEQSASADVSPINSRRPSFSQSQTNEHPSPAAAVTVIGANDHDSSLPISPIIAHRKSGFSNGTHHLASDPLFKLFRRPSLKGAAAIAAMAQNGNLKAKRHSDSGRAGLSAPPTAVSPDRRQSAYVGSSTNGFSNKSTNPSSRNSAGFLSSSVSPNFTFNPNPSTALPATSNLPSTAPSGPTASGALDLSDSDWTDLSWLVQAHPAAFSIAAPTTPRQSFSGLPVDTTIQASDPSQSPTTTLVSSSALQIAMQHYLGRWLNQYEINVIGTMQKFIQRKRTSTSVAAVSQQDLITFDVLQKVVANLHSILCQNPKLAVVDPLPSFAQALGLAAAGSDSGHMSMDELLAHLNTWSNVLPGDASHELRASFGGGIFHSPVLLNLLNEHKQLTAIHARLEKEYSLLTASRQNLDSSHADLSEQIPFLQNRIETLMSEKLAIEKELTRSQELAAQSSTHKAAFTQLQKKLQQVQEDSMNLRNELQMAKETQLSTEEELSQVTASENKLKEKLQSTEAAFKELQLKTNLKSAEDASLLRATADQNRQLEQRCEDLIERGQIYYRRLVQVGGVGDLEPMEDGMDTSVLVGSLQQSQLAQRMRPKASRAIRSELNDSLGAELDDFAGMEAMQRLEQQGVEIERLKQQLVALTNRVSDKDREIERLHSELDGAHANGSGKSLELGPRSDAQIQEDKKNEGCCAPCTIM